MFRRPFRKNGMPSVATLLKVYKIGDIVDIKADGSVHAGKRRGRSRGRKCYPWARVVCVSFGFA